MIDLVASRFHYWEHLAPVWAALPVNLRGTAYLGREFRGVVPAAGTLPSPRTNRVTIAASYDDLTLSNSPHTILFEHGCGQSYGGSRESAFAPGYAGGNGRDRAIAFLHPNAFSSDRDRARYPNIPNEIVGCPRLPGLQQIPLPAPGVRPVVAVSFHWHGPLCPETRSGFGHWWPAVRELHASGDVEVLGHAHPRLMPDVARAYERAGVEVVRRFETVLARAHVYVCDNSSTLFEAAAVGRPVVVLDNPGYRRDVDHGLRFWDCADVGPRVGGVVDLPEAIDRALAGPWPGTDAVLTRVFPAVEDPPAEAARAIQRVANQLRSATLSV